LLLSLATVVEPLMWPVGSLPSESLLFNMHAVSPYDRMFARWQRGPELRILSSQIVPFF